MEISVAVPPLSACSLTTKLADRPGKGRAPCDGRKLLILWCPGADLNHRHADFQSAALPLSYPGIPGL